MIKAIKVRTAAGLAVLTLLLGGPSAWAVLDSFGYDTYNVYDPGYDNNSYDDDWFYDYYEYDSNYDYEHNKDYDSDWFDWEEDGLFQ